MITAKHVVVDPKTDAYIDTDLLAFLNSKENKIVIRSIDEIKKTLDAKWIFHENRNVDVAILPFLVDLENDEAKQHTGQSIPRI